ncbi:MAG: hypothetical protein HYX48_08355 [Chlamydiales bacterium]|nr:hypothetical protein [Chlamydiales bacterium]
MRAIFFLISLLMVGSSFAAPAPLPTWSVVKSTHPFGWSAEFECTEGEVRVGKVVRSGLLCPRYYYDFYNSMGEPEVRGITRAFSWGLLFPWGVEIDLYDGDTGIGMIGGKFYTGSRAKFVFYNGQGRATAVAYLNSEKLEFVISSAENEGIILAELTGKAFGDVGVWEMKPLKPIPGVDPRALRIFIAFASDFHNSFMPPKQNIQYNNNSYNTYNSGSSR